MPQGGYAQYRIGSEAPFNGGGHRATIELDFKTDSSGMLVITSAITEMLGADGSVIASETDAPIIHEQLGSGRSHISIKKDTQITIKLAASKKWRFSSLYDAITTKEELTQFYGKLTYDRASVIEDSGQFAGHQAVMFYAKYDDVGRIGSSHGFSINIDLLQSGTPASGVWLPITIDPEIKNPPGSGGQLARKDASGNPVPVPLA